MSYRAKCKRRREITRGSYLPEPIVERGIRSIRKLTEAMQAGMSWQEAHEHAREAAPWRPKKYRPKIMWLRATDPLSPVEINPEVYDYLNRRWQDMYEAIGITKLAEEAAQ